jgi:hypothetical protein
MARVSLQLKEWNAEKLLAKSERVLEQLGPIYAAEADRQVTSVKWAWPVPVLRFVSLRMGGTPGPKGGVVVPAGNRDIVDTGRLLASRQEPQIQNNRMTIRWQAPYAMNIIKGSYGAYKTPAGNTVLPQQIARNWIDATYQALPAAKLFAEKWRVLR